MIDCKIECFTIHYNNEFNYSISFFLCCGAYMVKNYSLSAYFLTLFMMSSSFYVKTRPYVRPGASFCDTVLLMGAIQYPHLVDNVPMVRVYCGGNQIACDTNNETKKLTFSIPFKGLQSEFHILVAENIDWVMEEGLVKYLKVPSRIPYKLFLLQRVKDDSSREILPEAHSLLKTEKSKIHYCWSIKQDRLPETGRIPDDAIIVYEDPEYIAGLEGQAAGQNGASAYELPKLVMRTDLLEHVGSEKELHEHATKLLLSSLDYDAIHARVSQEVNHKAKTIVALTT